MAERDGGHPLGEPERACITRHRRRSSADRSDRAREPPKRCGQACWRARSPACCAGAASMPARSKATDSASLHSAAVLGRRVRPARTVLPRLEILPRIVRSPVDSCFGSPSQAPKSRPCVKPAPLPIAATTALEMIGPTPGTVITRWQASSCSASDSMSADTAAMRSSNRRQSWTSSAMRLTILGDNAPVFELRMSGNALRNAPHLAAR
jgi:hypothetical protein